MRIVTFEGRQHSFPADATDEEIAAALEGAAPAVPVKRGVYTRTDGQVGGLQKELDSEYANLKGAPDEEARQLAARNIIALRRTLGNKATDMPNIAGDANPDYVALLDMMDREEGRTDLLDRGGPTDAKTLPDTGKPIQPTPLRASQGDIRKTEPKPLPMEKQRADEADFAKQTDAWMAATGGVLKDGQTVQQAVAEWSGRQDPAGRRSAAQVEHLRETGELEGEDESVGMAAVKPAAAMIGFGVGGPAGATAAEAAVRYASVASALNKGVMSGAITEDEAAKILYDKLSKGVGQDALFNFGVPLLGQIAAKIPGAKWVGEKVGNLITAAAAKAGVPLGGSAPRPSQRDVKLADRADLTNDPARKAAINELAKRTEDFVPTPGQVTGEASKTETVIKRAFPEQFERQEKALTGAVDDMLRETTTPAGQMEAKTLGETITKIAEDTQRAVKTRLRPVFEAADNIGVQVDMREVRQEVSRALLADAKVAGGRLKPGERADLENIFEALRQNPNMTPEAVLDFISRRKELSRAMSADGAPSEFFSTILAKLTRGADTAYTRAAQAAGEGQVVKDLLRARQQYGSMMETIYDDAVKQALKKNPEDVGRLFWQSGNVSEIEQLHRMLRMAEKEGTVGAAGAQKVKQDMARGFLQEAVRDVDSAAKWLETIGKDPLKRRTWEALTAGPDGQAIRNAMEVLSNAAQIAKGSGMAGGGFIPLGRAAAGGVGVSYVTGVINPGMAVVGLSVAGLMRAMSTAYTHGDKGMVNLLARALRANGAGTAASAKVMQDVLPKIEAWAEKNGVQDLFVPADQRQ
jgi:hypothetical protein